jgi:hypothetical protein
MHRDIDPLVEQGALEFDRENSFASSIRQSLIAACANDLRANLNPTLLPQRRFRHPRLRQREITPACAEHKLL